MSTISDVVELVNDPYNGPEEGIDFWVDEQGHIQVNDTRTAGLILRRVNTSGQFAQNLVKIGAQGDSILLGFDTLVDIPAVHTVKIGFQNATLAEVKQDQTGKFCVYLDNKRGARMFNKLASAKTFIKRLDKDLKTIGTVNEDLED